MQIRSVMMSYCLQLKSGKYCINDISGNNEAVFLKPRLVYMYLILISLFIYCFHKKLMLFVRKSKLRQTLITLQ